MNWNNRFTASALCYNGSNWRNVAAMPYALSVSEANRQRKNLLSSLSGAALALMLRD